MNMTSDTLLLIGSIIVPFVGALIFLLGSFSNEKTLQKLAYFVFGFPCLAAVVLFLRFDPANDYCFEVLYDRMGLQELGITFHLGLNGVSSPLFAMSGIIGLSAGLAAIHSKEDRLHLYLALLAFMLTGLMGLFASIDLFFYYLFHEFALIPTFIMIGIWGGRDRRSISLEMTIYLTLGALVSLGGLVALNVMIDAPKFDFPHLSSAVSDSLISDSASYKIFGLLLFGFGILVALFPFHTWATRGYDAAPTSVSMLHAGVLKKFGLYGLIQIAVPLLPDAAQCWSPWIMWLALGNILLVGMVAVAQTSFKSMISYGSVMHMGYCFLGIGVCSTLGVGSAVMLMCAHGLSVALMFLLASFLHKRTHTFEMNEMGGLAEKTPLLACFCVAATLATIGLPGFGNFWGEFGVFLSLGETHEHIHFLVLAALGIILSAIFGLRAVASIFFGKESEELIKVTKKSKVIDLQRFEILPASLILCALLYLGLWPLSISDRIDREITSRYEHLNSDHSSFRPSCCPDNEDTKSTVD
jgi:NADH-quinone oxidoreductase subunit M